MTHEEKVKKIKITLLALGEYYHINLSDNQITMYTEDLSDLTPDQITRGIKNYRMNQSNTRFPLPGQIRSACDQGGVTYREAAVEMAAKILRLAGAYGRARYRDVCLHLEGQPTLAAIELMGWDNICNVTADELPSFRAQLRDMCEVAIKRHQFGTTETQKGPLLENKNKIQGILS